MKKRNKQQLKSKQLISPLHFDCRYDYGMALQPFDVFRLK